uniref:PDZ domain-containing protein n=1 Tax=Anopheles christyi TaxID=43041 RepID=A0A182KHA0_9DIPT
KNNFKTESFTLPLQSQVLEKVKPDRVTSTKPDEDRRRRTIIVEKKNGSYGFTLQSYGIHYKKEQEVEVITYVDYVEYDGPAYRAGMREGDVILSINGYDMEKAEHKDLVNFIKNCDNRMRMVVLFEDCCRKVELHLKYIQLQDLLKSKMADLERICLRERELLEGKWKTHSLPARKKANATSTADDIDPGATTDVESGSGPSFCRPAASTEDVKKLLRQKTYIVPPPAQFMLAYHCLDSNYRYVIHPSQAGTCEAASGTEYTPCAQQQNNPTAAKLCKDHQHMMRGSSLDSSSLGGGGICKQQQQSSASPTKSLHNYDTKAAAVAAPSKSSGSSRRSGHLHGHSCNPCMGHFMRSSSSDKARGGEKDNTSLDAYDLASPCCDPQCVPSRRKSKHHKDHHHKHKHRDREGKESGGKDRIPRPNLHNYDTKAAAVAAPSKSSGSSRRSGHLHGHSCNPCMGHFMRSSSSDKARGGEKDNTSLDAYDLASPCCDPQCVPSRRKSKHHKDHHHKHKHRDREGKESGGKDRIPRPKSQPHISPQQQQQPHNTQSNYLYRQKDKHDHHHSKVYDLNASLASHCSLHSCTSSEFNPAAENSPASYSTSISTDTLYWEPHSESTTVSASGSIHKKPPAGSSNASGALVPLGSSGRPPHTHQHHYYIQKYVHPQHHAALPGQQQQQLAIYPPPPPLPATVHKPKSWDNLAMKGYGGYGYGYGYLEVGGGSVGTKAGTNLPTATRTQTTITIQHRNSIPKKNGYERYSAFVDVENYAPPPTQFLQETTTTTTTITTKSTENLLGPYNRSDSSLSCECLETAPLTGGPGTSGGGGGMVEHVHDKSGYYSSLAGGGASGSGKKSNPNLTEIARL